MIVRTLVSISVIVLLALAASVVLFAALESTATFESVGKNLGGAAAGFVIILLVLSGWHAQLEKRRSQSLETVSTVARLAAIYSVRDANRSKEQLTQAYAADLATLKSIFRKHGRDWLNELETTFNAELEQQVHAMSELQGWSVPKRDVKDVIDLPDEEDPETRKAP